MKILDLFAGIGGFSLAGHWMGWETVAFVEWEPFCQKVLNKNFPNVPVCGDIKQFDGTKYRGTIDIICGGFPCQPFSTAGKRKGQDDDRYLWPEMLRVIREVRPAWVVGENVAGILSMDNGKVFEQICTSLESEGYSVQSFVIPACATGAPHRRDRVWIVGNADSAATAKVSGIRKRAVADSSGINEVVAHATSKQNKRENDKGFWPSFARSNLITSDTKWADEWLQVATRICRVDAGLPGKVDRNRAKRLKALGNAIVPQVAYEIFEAIRQAAIS